jgi:hypothetical protein
MRCIPGNVVFVMVIVFVVSKYIGRRKFLSISLKNNSSSFTSLQVILYLS